MVVVEVGWEREGPVGEDAEAYGESHPLGQNEEGGDELGVLAEEGGGVGADSPGHQKHPQAEHQQGHKLTQHLLRPRGGPAAVTALVGGRGGGGVIRGGGQGTVGDRWGLGGRGKDPEDVAADEAGDGQEKVLEGQQREGDEGDGGDVPWH